MCTEPAALAKADHSNPKQIKKSTQSRLFITNYSQVIRQAFILQELKKFQAEKSTFLQFSRFSS
jgi:hypothetical protein